jgi:hypothetical protein
VAELAPLFALAGEALQTEAAVGVLGPATMVDHAPTARLLALLDGVGAPIDVQDEPWAATDGGQGSAAVSVLLSELERAAIDDRVGDTALLALYLLDGWPEAADPKTLVACLRALRRVGLDRDARAIAVATALIDGF